MSNRKGMMVYKNRRIDWSYQTFRDASTFEIHPHWMIRVTNDKGQWVEWPDVQVDKKEIEGIHDLTEWPEQLLYLVLDNCIEKLDEEEPKESKLTHLDVEGNLPSWMQNKRK